MADSVNAASCVYRIKDKKNSLKKNDKSNWKSGAGIDTDVTPGQQSNNKRTGAEDVFVYLPHVGLKLDDVS